MKVVSLKEMKKIEKLSSGIFSFDLLTRGGIPIGKYTLIYGDKSTGKSTFSLRVCKSFLRKYPDRKILWIDFENSFDVEWAKRIIGYDTENLLIAQPDFAEDGIDILQENLQSPDVGLYIIDSLAMIVPQTEANADAEQSFIGQLARTVNSLLRKTIPYAQKHNNEGNPITFLLLNQLRNKIGQPSYMPQYSLPAGKFQEFLASIAVRFYQGKIDKDNEKIPTKIEYEFVIEKNKVGGIPKVVGSYTMALVNQGFYKAGDVMDENSIYKFAEQYGFITKTQKGYTLYGNSYKTQKELMYELYKNEDLKRKLISEIIEKYYSEE
ncbi:MAG: AAA family ATPase [Candidatus Aenigmatarchaeota archaeon]